MNATRPQDVITDKTFKSLSVARKAFYIIGIKLVSVKER
jgi:hypothetical protein